MKSFVGGMRPSLTGLIVLGVCFAGIAAGVERNDWLIVPGERVGPIRSGTTRADLIRMFGARNVSDGDVTVSDAGPEPGTRVFGRDPETSLIILWTNEKPQPDVAYITFCQSALRKSCRWHTPDGIGFGTTLRALEKMNGRPFKLAGFAFDYSGAVISWDGGRLERLRAHCPGLGIDVNPHGALINKQRMLYNQVIGDRDFWSSDPVMQALDPVVDELHVAFKGPGCARTGQ